MENNITMTTNNNKKEGNNMNAFNANPNNTINIVLQVNPEKLVGKTYKEMVEELTKIIIQNNVSIEGERPFPMECGKFYDINQEAIIKRASVDEFDGLIVALDVPFIQTDNPTLDSICAPELPEDEDEDDEEEEINMSTFKLYKDTKNIKDSLQFDSGTLIAEYIDNDLSARIEVVGDVRIIFEGDVFKYPSNFSDERIEVCENNWFELIVIDNTNNTEIDMGDDPIIAVEGLTAHELKDLLISILNSVKERN